jgi:hypothetical protein
VHHAQAGAIIEVWMVVAEAENQTKKAEFKVSIQGFR